MAVVFRGRPPADPRPDSPPSSSSLASLYRPAAAAPVHRLHRRQRGGGRRQPHQVRAGREWEGSSPVEQRRPPPPPCLLPLPRPRLNRLRACLLPPHLLSPSKLQRGADQELPREDAGRGAAPAVGGEPARPAPAPACLSASLCRCYTPPSLESLTLPAAPRLPPALSSRTPNRSPTAGSPTSASSSPGPRGAPSTRSRAASAPSASLGAPGRRSTASWRRWACTRTAGRCRCS